MFFFLVFLLWCHLQTNAQFPVIPVMHWETVQLTEPPENNNSPSQRKQKLELH